MQGRQEILAGGLSIPAAGQRGLLLAVGAAGLLQHHAGCHTVVFAKRGYEMADVAVPHRGGHGADVHVSIQEHGPGGFHAVDTQRAVHGVSEQFAKPLFELEVIDAHS